MRVRSKVAATLATGYDKIRRPRCSAPQQLRIPALQAAQPVTRAVEPEGPGRPTAARRRPARGGRPSRSVTVRCRTSTLRLPGTSTTTAARQKIRSVTACSRSALVSPGCRPYSRARRSRLEVSRGGAFHEPVSFGGRVRRAHEVAARHPEVEPGQRRPAHPLPAGGHLRQRHGHQAAVVAHVGAPHPVGDERRQRRRLDDRQRLREDRHQRDGQRHPERHPAPVRQPGRPGRRPARAAPRRPWR